MKTRTRITGIASAAVLAAAAGLSMVTPARAAALTGVCETSAGTQHCFRASYQDGSTREWNRDISGDPLQQFSQFNYGTVAQTGCLYNLPATIRNSFANNEVVAIRDQNNYYIGAAYHAYLGEDQSGHSAGNWYDFWTYSSSGALINCGQSQYWGALDSVCHVPNTAQLYALGSCLGITWSYIGV